MERLGEFCNNHHSCFGDCHRGNGQSLVHGLFVDVDRGYLFVLCVDAEVAFMLRSRGVLGVDVDC